MSVEIVQQGRGLCSCEARDPEGVDPGCLTHGEHPCANWQRQPHAEGEWGRGCCAHCTHVVTS